MLKLGRSLGAVPRSLGRVASTSSSFGSDAARLSAQSTNGGPRPCRSTPALPTPGQLTAGSSATLTRSMTSTSGRAATAKRRKVDNAYFAELPPSDLARLGLPAGTSFNDLATRPKDYSVAPARILELLLPSGPGSAIQYLPGERFPSNGIMQRVLTKSLKSDINLEQIRALVRMVLAEYDNLHLLGQLASFLASQTLLSFYEKRKFALQLEARLRTYGETDHDGWPQLPRIDAIGAVKQFDRLRPGFTQGPLQLSLPTLLKVDDALALMPVEYHRVRLHALNRWLVRDTSKPISSDNILGFLSPAVRWADHDPVCLLFILHAVLQTLKPPVAPDAPGYRLQRLVLDRIRETQQEWPALTQRHPTFAPIQSHAEACSEARTLAQELKPVLGPASALLDAFFKEKAA